MTPATSSSSGRTTAAVVSGASGALGMRTLKFVTARTAMTSISTPAVSGATKGRSGPAAGAGRGRKYATTAKEGTVMGTRTPRAPSCPSQVKSLSPGGAPGPANPPTTRGGATDCGSEPAAGAPVRALVRPVAAREDPLAPEREEV